MQEQHTIATNLSPSTDSDELKAIIGENEAGLIEAADEIVSGTLSIFGHKKVPVNFTSTTPLQHWTDYKDFGKQQDIKFIWEPARFGWALVLARAYHLSRDEKYAQTFWQYTEEFLHANPPNLGPHWMSAQEVGLRLICLVFAYQIFASSPESSPKRQSLLAAAIATHAARIPPTLSYARAQNNNHLISEATALYTAGLALPTHPKASKWLETGWRWLCNGLDKQIANDGTYMQHSANYHRLVTQLALWANTLAAQEGRPWPLHVQTKLSQASLWLLRIMDFDSGQTPNLGPNDGAYILPLSTSAFEDHRSTVQAANLTFNQTQYFEDGPWNEMALWLGLNLTEKTNPLTAQKPIDTEANTPHMLRNPGHKSWAYLRAARFNDRPGHADQLHLDLWWRGLNVAQDAGTYLYNAAAPWNNSLAGTDAHNTLTINGLHQMSRAGRFLWLDWAQAHIQAEERTDMQGWYKGLMLQRVSAVHNGFRQMGITHRREVYYDEENRWHIEDSVLGKATSQTYNVRLHWLLPDWEWELKANILKIKSPHGWVQLYIHGNSKVAGKLDFQLVRAGEVLHGEGEAKPHWGWVSPTYDQKLPALSFATLVHAAPPLTLHTTWEFPQ